MVNFTSIAGAGSTLINSADPEERSFKRLLFRDDSEDATPKAIGTDATTAEITNNLGTQGTVMPVEGSRMIKVDNVGATDATYYYKVGKLKDGKVGVDMWFWKNSDLAAFEIIFAHYDKVTVETYKVKFLESGMKWQYHNGAGAYADITGGAEDIGDNCWNRIHLVIDLANLEYYRLESNGLNIDLSGISAQTAADAATEGHTIITVGITAGANNKACYTDDFRIYINDE